MKWLYDYDVKTYELDEPGFQMDIVLYKDVIEVWLYKTNIGIKDFIIGEPWPDVMERYGSDRKQALDEYPYDIADYLISIDAYADYDERYDLGGD